MAYQQTALAGKESELLFIVCLYSKLEETVTSRLAKELRVKIAIIFLSTNLMYVMGALKDRLNEMIHLNETILLSSHNMCFVEKILGLYKIR